MPLLRTSEEHIGDQTHLYKIERHGTVRLVAVLHVSLQINVEKFKNKVQLLVCVHDVEESGEEQKYEGISQSVG